MSLLLLLRHSASIKCCPRICTPSNCAGSSQFSARHGGDVDAAVNDVVEKLLKVPEGVERVILEITPAVLFYECGIFILSNPIPSVWICSYTYCITIRFGSSKTSECCRFAVHNISAW